MGFGGFWLSLWVLVVGVVD